MGEQRLSTTWLKIQLKYRPFLRRRNILKTAIEQSLSLSLLEKKKYTTFQPPFPLPSPASPAPPQSRSKSCPVLFRSIHSVFLERIRLSHRLGWMTTEKKYIYERKLWISTKLSLICGGFVMSSSFYQCRQTTIIPATRAPITKM